MTHIYEDIQNTINRSEHTLDAGIERYCVPRLETLGKED